MFFLFSLADFGRFMNVFKDCMYDLAQRNMAGTSTLTDLN